jgi:ADP-heptose:LPS heptosyltransferase
MSSVGDIVLAEPVVSAIREARPDAKIGFAVKERYRDLVAGNPDISTIHALRDGSRSAVSSLCAEVRRELYSAAVDLHCNAKSVLLSRLSGARLISRYRKRDAGDSLRVRLGRRAYRASKMIVERYLDALEPLGIDHAYRRPRFRPTGEAVGWARHFLSGAGLSPGRFAAIVPGSVWPTKMWPPERYATLASGVGGELGLPVLLLGSSDEHGLCERAAVGSAATNVAGRATLGQTAALIGMAGLYIGNDSGPTHIAMASGVPTVAIFGPTDPGQFDFSGHALVYANLPCSACSFFGTDSCRLKHWDCMLSLSVDDVMSAARGLLAGRAEA